MSHAAGSQRPINFQWEIPKALHESWFLNDWLTFENVAEAPTWRSASDSFVSVGLGYLAWKYKRSRSAETVPQSNCHGMSTVTASQGASTRIILWWCQFVGTVPRRRWAYLKAKRWCYFRRSLSIALTSGIYVLNGEPCKAALQVMKAKVVRAVVPPRTELSRCQNPSVLLCGIGNVEGMILWNHQSQKLRTSTKDKWWCCKGRYFPKLSAL